ncbi:hypothetical protein EDD18DRAFT_1413215 [Armillaria luteobubalina]|uniref:Uncharacterized protein n=1 Tax=Armillaria luteobubalina TaxID=153913 RepID=A0AA39QMD3_9AGAR|nr:hypothetical protein EDD18DRAFT_1413215 [Armillaria luteobubalina]
MPTRCLSRSKRAHPISIRKVLNDFQKEKAHIPIVKDVWACWSILDSLQAVRDPRTSEPRVPLLTNSVMQCGDQLQNGKDTVHAVPELISHDVTGKAKVVVMVERKDDESHFGQLTKHGNADLAEAQVGTSTRQHIQESNTQNSRDEKVTEIVSTQNLCCQRSWWWWWWWYRHKVPIRNGRAHSPDMAVPCAVATKAHAVVITLLSASRGLEYLCGVQTKRK